MHDFCIKRLHLQATVSLYSVLQSNKMISVDHLFSMMEKILHNFLFRNIVATNRFDIYFNALSIIFNQLGKLQYSIPTINCIYRNNVVSEKVQFYSC